MDISSSSKKQKHKKNNKKSKGNAASGIKAWFLSMSLRRRTVVIALIAIVLVLAIAISFIGAYIIKLSNSYHHDNDFGIDNIEQISAEVINIALFGVDTRDMESISGLSDSIMVLSLNKKEGKIKIVSVMRDSLVKIPGYDNPRKINSAYSLGGPELAVKTLNSNFGLDIKEYATVNFLGMADIIDAVGGINVNVLKSELNAYNGLNHNIEHQAAVIGVEPQYVEKAGYQKLNGLQAVAWARIRSVATEGGEGNDFGRTDRQRYVMEQLLNTAIGMGVSEYPTLVNSLLPYVRTSLSVSELLSLSSLLAKDLGFEESRIPQDRYIINGNFSVSGVGSTVYYNLDYASKVLYSYIYEGVSPEDYMKQNGVDKTGWYGKGTTTSKPVNTSSQTIVSQSGNSSKKNETTSSQNVTSAPTETTTSEETATSKPTSSVQEDKTSSDKMESEDASSDEIVSQEASSEETATEGNEEEASSQESSSEEVSSEASSTEEAPTDSETEVSKEPENSVESEETDTSEEPTDSAAEEPFESEENETTEEAA